MEKIIIKNEYAETEKNDFKEAAILQNYINAINSLSEKERLYAGCWRDIYESYDGVMRLIAGENLADGASNQENKISGLKEGMEFVKKMEAEKEISGKRAKQVRGIVFASLKQLGKINDKIEI